MQKNTNIDDGAPFYWGRAAKDYAEYRDIYPEEFYQRILDIGVCQRGQTVLDLATGTGVLPRALYRHGARFVGVDIAEEQIAEARELSQAQNMDIAYRVSAVEEADFPEGSFDVVMACQCWIYFDQQVILPKIYRWLKPEGHLCILWMAWLPDEDEIARQSENLVLKYNPAWTGAGYMRCVPEIPEAAIPYFVQEHALAYDILIPFTRQSWHGRMMACRGMGASSLPQAVIRQFEEQHWGYLETVPERFAVRHYVTVLCLGPL
ncbi:MAG: class I SAM-dependent methyltransferase [Peptococcaceae bacterium]|nr:class I SAM-dependent methyltransferase [Peptococcaceae bacterium]